MSQDRPTPTPPDDDVPAPTAADAVRARVMFALGFVHLLLVAGVVHRMPTPSVTPWEVVVLIGGLVVVWPVFVIEAVWGVYRRDRSKPRRPVVLRAALVILLPPWRMALRDPRTGLVWLPRLGWQTPGKELFKRLERGFSGPMLLFAFLILPILFIEYVWAEEARNTPGFQLALDIGIAVVWVAFAFEFALKASVHPKPFSFMKERWLDAAIVILPMLEFLLTRWVDAAPIARLMRAARALSPEQIARMQRLYRLQGVATKAWHALLLLEGVARLFGVTPEKRLAKIEERIAELEEQLKEARDEADELRAALAARMPPDAIIPVAPADQQPTG